MSGGAKSGAVLPKEERELSRSESGPPGQEPGVAGSLDGMGTLLLRKDFLLLFPARILFIYFSISFSREIFCHISGVPHARDLQDQGRTVPEFNHSTGANGYE